MGIAVSRPTHVHVVWMRSLRNSDSWDGINAHSGESFARIDHKSGLFAKGYAGLGAVRNGTLNDEDFLSKYGPLSIRVTATAETAADRA